MKKYVFDSFALIVYLEKEKNWEKVSDIFKKALDNKAQIFLSVVNWGEIYYIALREGSIDRAELYCKTIDNYPINLVDVNREITLIAARYKSFYKLSYADCFAAALADYKRAILVTGDKEFEQLGKAIRINWI